MKLYTEEQVREAMHMKVDIKYITYTDDNIVDSLTPIELPTDEEIGVIALNIADTLQDKLNSKEEAFYLAGFQTCADWMRDKIKVGEQ